VDAARHGSADLRSNWLPFLVFRMAASCVGVNGHFDRWELDAARRVQKLVHLVVCSRESIVKCAYLNTTYLITRHKKNN
jgi:hypothetical protein